MRSDLDPDFLENFPELFDPEVNLSKEFLAHYGLLMSAYGVLETSLQNCFLFWQKKVELEKKSLKTQMDWENHHDTIEKKAFGATLGKLISYLSDCKEINIYKAELNELKRKRDYFVHHFFRENALHMKSSATTIEIMASFHTIRASIKRCELGCDEIGLSMLSVYYPNSNLPEEIANETERSKAEFQKQFEGDNFKFRWDQNEPL